LVLISTTTGDAQQSDPKMQAVLRRPAWGTEHGGCGCGLLGVNRMTPYGLMGRFRNKAYKLICCVQGGRYAECRRRQGQE